MQNLPCMTKPIDDLDLARVVGGAEPPFTKMYDQSVKAWSDAATPMFWGGMLAGAQMGEAFKSAFPWLYPRN